MTRPFERLAWLALATLLIGSCGGGGVRGEAPFVQVTSWRVDNGNVIAAMRLRNVNDETLVIDRLALDVTLDGQAFVDLQETRRIEVAANGFETVRLEAAADPAGLERLARLDAGGTTSLPFTLEGHVESPRDGRLAFSREGHLYPVPGRSGQYR